MASGGGRASALATSIHYRTARGSSMSAIGGGGRRIERGTTSSDVDLDCILYTADLTSLPVDALRQTLKKLKVATAKLPTRPEPTIVETVEDIEFTCFSDKADFENYCKFDVQESLEQLLEGKTGQTVAQSVWQKAERDDGTTSRASSSGLDGSVFRRKRKSTQAAVPFKEQFTYSMDFLDDEHFGERYVDVDEYDETIIPQYDRGGHAKQARRASSLTIQQNNNRPQERLANKRPLQTPQPVEPKTGSSLLQRRKQVISNSQRRAQMQKAARGNVDEEDEEVTGLEETIALDECFSDDEEQLRREEQEKRAAAQQQMNRNPKPMLARRSLNQPPPTSTGTMPPLSKFPPPTVIDVENDDVVKDISRYEGSIPFFFLTSEKRPDFPGTFEEYLQYQNKLYKRCIVDRAAVEQANENGKMRSLLRKPDMSVIKDLREMLIPGGIINRNPQQKSPASVAYQQQFNKNIRLLQQQGGPQYQGQRQPNPNLNGQMVNGVPNSNQVMKTPRPSMVQYQNTLNTNRQMLVRNYGSAGNPADGGVGGNFSRVTVAGGTPTTNVNNTGNPIGPTVQRIITPILVNRGQPPQVQQTYTRNISVAAAGINSGSTQMGLRQKGSHLAPMLIPTPINPPSSLRPSGSSMLMTPTATPANRHPTPLKVYSVGGTSLGGFRPQVMNGGGGSVTIKPSNYVHIAPKPAGGGTGGVSGVSSGTAALNNAVAAGGKITIQVLKGPGGGVAGQNVQLINGQSVRLVSLPGSTASGAGALSNSGSVGNAGEKTLVAVPLSMAMAMAASAGGVNTTAGGGMRTIMTFPVRTQAGGVVTVAGSNSTATVRNVSAGTPLRFPTLLSTTTAASGGGSTGTSGGTSSLVVVNNVEGGTTVQPRKITIVASGSNTPGGNSTTTSGTTTQQYLPADLVKQLVQANQASGGAKNTRFVFRSPTPVLSSGRTVSIQTMVTTPSTSMFTQSTTTTNSKTSAATSSSTPSATYIDLEAEVDAPPSTAPVVSKAAVPTVIAPSNTMNVAFEEEVEASYLPVTGSE